MSGNAVDGNLVTFWNDANPAAYPAVLTITSPSPWTRTPMPASSPEWPNSTPEAKLVQEPWTSEVMTDERGEHQPGP
jgi:hypothetical protein